MFLASCRGGDFIKQMQKCLLLVFRYFRQHTKPSGKDDKRNAFASALPLLIYPRLSVLRVIVEVGRRAIDGAKSAVSHGWLQALSTCTITLKMLQAPEGLNCRKKTFCFRFWSFQNKGPRQGCPVSSAKAHRSPGVDTLAAINVKPIQ